MGNATVLGAKNAMKLRTIGDVSRASIGWPQPRYRSLPAIARYAAPMICSWLIDAGTIATLASAATSVITEAICGAS
jgi:hypothetical protein